MKTTSDDLSRRVVDALGRGSRSDRTLRLADAFAAAIEEEAAGAPLPSLRTLAGETGAHRNTVRAALELLADTGLVDRRPVAATARRRAQRRRGGRAARAVAVDWRGGRAAVPRARAGCRWPPSTPPPSGLVLAAEIELDDVRARLPLAEVLGVGVSVTVDVELGLADAPAGARVRIDASPSYVVAVGQVIGRVRPDVHHVVSGPTDLVLVPAGAPAPPGQPRCAASAPSRARPSCGSSPRASLTTCRRPRPLRARRPATAGPRASSRAPQRG